MFSNPDIAQRGGDVLDRETVLPIDFVANNAELQGGTRSGREEDRDNRKEDKQTASKAAISDQASGSRLKRRNSRSKSHNSKICSSTRS